MTGERLGRATGFGDGARESQADPFQPRMKVAPHFGLATEEMRHTGDIGDKPVRAVARHHWRIATCPPSEACQCPCFLCEIGAPGDQLGADGAGIGRRHAGMQSACLGGRVQAMHMIGIP